MPARLPPQSGPMRPLDHLVHAVPDLDRAAGAYQDLGFRVTPRADHPFGTSNRLIILEGTYLELVAVTRPELMPATNGYSFARVVQQAVEAGGGAPLVALRSEDPVADHASLADGGWNPLDPFHFSRLAPHPDGSAGEASFTLVFVPHPSVPLSGGFLCRHHTPQEVWQPGQATHPNGANRVVELELGADRSTVAMWEALAGEPAEESGEGWLIPLADGCRLRLTPPLERHRPGFRRLRLAGGQPVVGQVAGLGVEVVAA